MWFSDKRYIKAALKEVYAVPKPARKKEFFCGLGKKRISGAQFMLSQVLYIRKLTWIFSTALIGALVWLTGYINEGLVWTIAACMPFVAMIAVTENMRSCAYKMEELEMSARFSLKSVVFARMSIIGIFHLLLLCVLVFFTGKNAEVSYLRTGVYLLVPYLMTAAVSMHVARRIRSTEVNYVCMGVATIVAALDGVVQSMIPIVTAKEYFGYWVILLVMLTVCTIIEYCKSIFRMEEALWSL